MASDVFSNRIDRRTVIKTAALAGVAQIASPFVVTSWAADVVKIGLDNPLTGTYAALGKNELIGSQYAIEQINAKGGILGRKVELLVEDSTSGDAGTAVQKARKLIDRDKVDFLVGNINSALAQAIANVSFEKKVFHVVPGGHTNSVTGSNCHWDVFRICNTTQMEASAVASTLIKTAGKKWYYLTPDYAFGHTLQAGLEKAAAKLGGTKLGGDLTPLGTTDYSSYLIKAQAANPDVIIFLQAGDDAVNALKQAVQFGLNKKYPSGRRAAGTGSAARPPAGSPHRHLGVRMVLETAERPAREGIRRRDPQEERRSRSHRAHLVRLRGDAHLRACGRASEIARCGEDGQGDAGLQASAGSLADAGRSLTSVKARVSSFPTFTSGMPNRRAPTIPRIFSWSTRSSRAPTSPESLEETGCKQTWPA